MWYESASSSPVSDLIFVYESHRPSAERYAIPNHPVLTQRSPDSSASRATILFCCSRAGLKIVHSVPESEQRSKPRLPSGYTPPIQGCPAPSIAIEVSVFSSNGILYSCRSIVFRAVVC